MSGNTLTVSSPERPSPERLRSSRDFRRVLTGGTRASAGPIQAVMAPGLAGHTRFGVSVGRTTGNAVKRNLVKRRLRSISRMVDLPAGMDVVIVAKPGAAGKTFQETAILVGDAVSRASART